MNTAKRLILFFCVTLMSYSTGVYSHGGDTSLIHTCVNSQDLLRLSGPNLDCNVGETPLDWSAQNPVDTVLLARIATLEAQIDSLVNPVLPDISISDVTLPESNNFSFTVTLSVPSSETVTVNFLTTPGTADATDYTPRNGRLVFFPGQTSKTVGISIIHDTVLEADETFLLSTGTVYNANPASVSGIGTILNDDEPPPPPPPPPPPLVPSISVSGQSSGLEGDLFSYAVSLSVATTTDVFVNYSVVDGTATLAGNDFISTGGTLVFSPGQTTANFSVQTNTDTALEGLEDFSVQLNTPVNGVISTTAATVTTSISDASLGISIQDVSVIEGNRGSSPFTIMRMNITLDQAVAGLVSVRFGQTAGGTASGYTFFNTAGDVRVIQWSSCHADTSPATCPTLTFQPGQAVKTINIQINGDRSPELDENFFIKIFDPVGAVISRGVAEGIIVNDD